MQTQRGTFLSILIPATGAAISLASVALVVDRDIQRILGVLPEWFSLFVLILGLARLLALWGIWNLRRWGVYAFFVLELVELSMGLFVFTSVLTLGMSVAGVSAFLLLVGIYILALKPKWQWLR